MEKYIRNKKDLQEIREIFNASRYCFGNIRDNIGIYMGYTEDISENIDNHEILALHLQKAIEIQNYILRKINFTTAKLKELTTILKTKHSDNTFCFKPSVLEYEVWK